MTMRYKGRFQSAMPDGGSAPLSLTSKVVCTNLNADLLDGLHASEIVAQTLLDENGKIPMAKLPDDLASALIAVVEQQQQQNDTLKETNELLLRLLLLLEEKSEQEGVVIDGLRTPG